MAAMTNSRGLLRSYLIKLLGVLLGLFVLWVLAHFFHVRRARFGSWGAELLLAVVVSLASFALDLWDKRR